MENWIIGWTALNTALIMWALVKRSRKVTLKGTTVTQIDKYKLKSRKR